MLERGVGLPTERREVDQRDEWTELRAGAAGLVAGLGAFFLVRYLTVSGGLSLLRGVMELPFFLLSLSLLYAGCWLLRSDYSTRRVGRIAAWSLAGFVALVAIAVWLVAGQNAPLQQSLLLTVDVGAVGASTGLVVGLESERRQRRVGRDALAASLAAERAEDRFVFLNQLLRHHLLNGVAVVRGHAEMLAAVHDDPPEEVEIIRRRSDEIVALVRNIETLTRAFNGDLPLEAVDTVPPLRASIQTVQSECPTAEVRLDAGEGALVTANDRIGLAFEAILRIVVGAAGEEPVTVTVEDGSPGEDRDRSGTLLVSFGFEKPVPRITAATSNNDVYGQGDLGYFLAETLIEHFGGTIQVSIDGRTEISVRLLRAE